jgi:protein-tyrosine phosphatase
VKILFVCAGNTCRSPMAAALAKQLLPESMSVESAGMETADGMMATREAVAMMHEIGIDISAHRSRSLDGLYLTDYDLFIALTPSIAENLTAIRKISPDRVRVMNVPDPYSKGPPAYRRCLEQLTRQLPSVLPMSTNAYGGDDESS